MNSDIKLKLSQIKEVTDGKYLEITIAGEAYVLMKKSTYQEIFK